MVCHELFCFRGQAKPYWANKSDNEIIREILTGLTPEISDDPAKVMQGEKIHTYMFCSLISELMENSRKENAALLNELLFCCLASGFEHFFAPDERKSDN